MVDDIGRVIDDILNFADSSFDVRAIEPLLGDLLSLIERAPQCRSEYARALSALLVPEAGELPLTRPGTVEILEFTMHRLRWPEVRDALQVLASNATDWRVKRAAERVLEAYADEWDGGDIYDTYRV